MDCKGLKGRRLKKCMKTYVKESTRRFPTFNKEKDTVSTTISSNSLSGILAKKAMTRNPKIIRELKASISPPKITKSTSSKDKSPYKLKTHRKKK